MITFRVIYQMGETENIGHADISFPFPDQTKVDEKIAWIRALRVAWAYTVKKRSKMLALVRIS